MELISSADDLGNIIGYTSDDFYQFAKSADMSGDLLSQYKAHLADTTKQTTLFAKGLSTAKTVIGTVSSALFNMATMYAISKGIELIGTAIYDTIYATEIAIEKGEEARQKISDIKDYI